MWYAGKIFRLVVTIILLVFCIFLLCSTAEGATPTYRNGQLIRGSIRSSRGCLNVRRRGFNSYAYRRYRRYRDRRSNRRYRRDCGWRVRRGYFSTPIRLKNRRLRRYNRLHAGSVIVYEKGRRPYVR